MGLLSLLKFARPEQVVSGCLVGVSPRHRSFVRLAEKTAIEVKATGDVYQTDGFDARSNPGFVLIRIFVIFSLTRMTFSEIPRN